MPASITAFSESHIPDALALWRASENIGLSSADSPAALRRFLDRNPGLSFCAIDSDRLVGTILCGTDGRRGYIYHLAVAEHCRRETIGSRLLLQSLEALADRKIAKCHAFVYHENPYAELFWRAIGWELRKDLVVYSKPLPGG